MISAPARSPSPAACVAASTLASTDSRSPRMMNQALPPIPRARCKSCSRTSAALQAASAERSAAATECSSTRPAGSSEAACARPAGPARTAGRICSCACGRKRRSMRQSPAAATPAATDSSVSPTPPAKSTRYLPGLTGPHWSSSTRARLATASATTTPRARDDTSSSASAGGEPAVGDEWLDNAELVLQGAAPLAGDAARGSEADAGRLGDLARVLADEVAVDVAVARHDRLLQPGQPRAVDLDRAVAQHLALERIGDAPHREQFFLDDADDVVVHPRPEHDVAARL